MRERGAPDLASAAPALDVQRPDRRVSSGTQPAACRSALSTVESSHAHVEAVMRRMISGACLAAALLLVPAGALAEPFTVLPDGSLVVDAIFSTHGVFTC